MKEGKQEILSQRSGGWDVRAGCGTLRSESWLSFPHTAHVTACSRVGLSVLLELLLLLWSLGKVLEPGECLIH